MNDQRKVWLLWHGDDIYDETPDAKLLGIYSSQELAADRIRRSSDVQGFRDHPEAFEIVSYTVDQDEWTEGYVRVD